MDGALEMLASAGLSMGIAECMSALIAVDLVDLVRVYVGQLNPRKGRVGIKLDDDCLSVGRSVNLIGTCLGGCLSAIDTTIRVWCNHNPTDTDETLQVEFLRIDIAWCRWTRSLRMMVFPAKT